jgi:transporter family-2 protein
MNTELADWVNSPFRAAFVSFLVGTLVLLVVAALVVAGQALASLAVDHFGWVGFEENPISIGRVGGMLLIAAGVVLVRIF